MRRSPTHHSRANYWSRSGGAAPMVITEIPWRPQLTSRAIPQLCCKSQENPRFEVLVPSKPSLKYLTNGTPGGDTGFNVRLSNWSWALRGFRIENSV